ncbi:MAG: helix-turn-helix domain-containing protein [Chloroflexota bacterium]
MKDAQDDIMTVNEVAAYLKLHVSTVYKLAQEEKIPCKKIGGRWRFSRQRLKAWVQEKLT